MERYRVLIAARVRDEVEELRKALVSTGYETKVVDNGLSALSLCREFRPHVVLAEVELPKLDGHHLFRELKAQSATRNLPFMLMSRHRSVEERVHSIELGVDDYVSMPFDVDEVMLRIEILLKEVQRLKDAVPRQTKGFSGKLADMNVIEILQTLEIGRKTGEVTVISDVDEGRIFVRDGQVLDAELEELEPRKALFRMFTWNDGTFRVELKAVERTRAFQESTEELLQAGRILRDRWEKIARGLPPLQATVKVVPKLSREEYSEAERVILGLSHESTRIIDLVRRSPLDDLDALRVVANLFYQGSLKETAPPQRANGEAERSRLQVPGNGAATSPEVLTRLINNFLKPEAMRENGHRKSVLAAHTQPAVANGSLEGERVHLNKSELLMIRNKLANGKSEG